MGSEEENNEEDRKSGDRNTINFHSLWYALHYYAHLLTIEIALLMESYCRAPFFYFDCISDTSIQYRSVIARYKERLPPTQPQHYIVPNSPPIDGALGVLCSGGKGFASRFSLYFAVVLLYCILVTGLSRWQAELAFVFSQIFVRSRWRYR